MSIQSIPGPKGRPILGMLPEMMNDMLGMFNDFRPRFVKRYADVGALVREAAASYCGEVRAGSFPDKEHSFR